MAAHALAVAMQLAPHSAAGVQGKQLLTKRCSTSSDHQAVKAVWQGLLHRPGMHPSVFRHARNAAANAAGSQPMFLAASMPTQASEQQASAAADEEQDLPDELGVLDDGEVEEGADLSAAQPELDTEDGDEEEPGTPSDGERLLLEMLLCPCRICKVFAA